MLIYLAQEDLIQLPHEGDDNFMGIISWIVMEWIVGVSALVLPFGYQVIKSK